MKFLISFSSNKHLISASLLKVLDADRQVQEEEAEWIGLTVAEAVAKGYALEKERNPIVPLKEVFIKQLIQDLKDGKQPEIGDSITGEPREELSAVPKKQEDLLRREFCLEAKKYGDVKYDFNDKPRRITVFLNPAAASGKARKLFEKTAGPVLFLAGMEVTVVKTEYEGQVKLFMSALESKDTDGVVVAGGDGTLLEAITGLMRKEDKSLRQNIPVGVIPLGETNRFAQLMFGSDKEQLRLILESTMAVVRGFHKKVDVLSIQGEDGRSTFALSGLETGAFRDTKARIPKYWYFGPLKARVAYLIAAMKEWPPVFKAKISYVLATEENTKPKVPQIKQTNNSRSWFSFLYRAKPIQPVFTDDDMYPDDDPEDESDFITEDLSTLELTMDSTNLQDSSQHIKGVEVGLDPEDPERSSFISEGWRRINDKSLKTGSPTNRKLLVKKIKVVPEIMEGKEAWFNIDGERFEVMPIEVKLLRNRLRFFCSQIEDKIS